MSTERQRQPDRRSRERAMKSHGIAWIKKGEMKAEHLGNARHERMSSTSNHHSISRVVLRECGHATIQALPGIPSPRPLSKSRRVAAHQVRRGQGEVTWTVLNCRHGGQKRYCPPPIAVVLSGVHSQSMAIQSGRIVPA